MPKLILVPTPIGNLEDMTPRAMRTLREAELILCEDTRTTGQLLTLLELRGAPLASYHMHNEHKMLPSLIERIRSLGVVALVSDAGTPGVSDPGFLLVRAAIEAGIEVECLPGATALIPALVASGLPMDRFVFEGFLPMKKGRHTRLTALQSEERTIILYESPHKLLKTLTQLREYLGERQVAVCRELSKLYEEVRRGTLSEVIDHFTHTAPRGEFVLVIAGAELRKERTKDYTQD